VRDELITILGKDTGALHSSRRSRPAVNSLMAGLQGSGKTHTSGKLRPGSRRGPPGPFLSPSTSTAPPRAEQLRVVAKSIEAKIYEATRKASPPARRCERSPPRPPRSAPISALTR